MRQKVTMMIVLTVNVVASLSNDSTVTLVHPYGDDAHEVFEAAADAFSRISGLHIQIYQERSFNTLYNSIKANLSQEVGADVVLTANEWVSELNEEGFLSSITPELDAWAVKRGIYGRIESDFVNNLRISYTFPTKETKVKQWHLLPFDIHAHVLFYRRDLYLKYLNHDRPPTTIGDAKRNGKILEKAVRAHENATLWSWAAPDVSGTNEVMQILVSFIHGQGSSFVSAKKGECSFSDKLFHYALSSYTDLFESHHPWRQANLTDIAEEFKNGRVAHMTGPPRLLSFLFGVENNTLLSRSAVGIAQVPAGPVGPFNFLGGSGWAIPSWVQGSKRNVTWSFIEYLMDPRRDWLKQAAFSESLIPAYESILREARQPAPPDCKLGRIILWDGNHELKPISFSPTSAGNLSVKGVDWTGFAEDNVVSFTITFDAPVTITSYQFVTSSDTTTGDPISWNIHGRNRDHNETTLVDTRTAEKIPFMRGVSTRVFMVSRLGAYSSYDVKIVKLRGISCGEICRATTEQMRYSVPLSFPSHGCFKIARLQANRTVQRLLERVLNGSPVDAATHQACLEMMEITADPKFPENTPSSSSDYTTVIVLTILVSFLAVILILGASWGWTWYKQRKYSRHAPRDGEIAFVFTDIQKSSDLWSSDAAVMTEALHLHHGIIRSQIERFCGYEVKTLGDSFMVAFKDAVRAVDFMCQVQQLMFDTTWPPSLACHPATQQDTLFNGLRVRMGCHVGRANVVKSPQGAYDYDGTAVNQTARVSDSGHGGQILITEEVYTLIEPGLDMMVTNDVEVKYLGEYTYEGVANPVRVIQLLPCKLMDRVFPQLRKAKVVVCTDDSSVASSVEEFKKDTLLSVQAFRKHVAVSGGHTGISMSTFAQLITTSVPASDSALVTEALLALAIEGCIQGKATASKRRTSSARRLVKQYTLKWNAISGVLRCLPASTVISMAAKLPVTASPISQGNMGGNPLDSVKKFLE